MDGLKISPFNPFNPIGAAAQKPIEHCMSSTGFISKCSPTQKTPSLLCVSLQLCIAGLKAPLMKEEMENLPILQDFVSYRGCCLAISRIDQDRARQLLTICLLATDE